MPLSPGTRLGHYDVTALLGEGGLEPILDPLCSHRSHQRRPVPLKDRCNFDRF